MESIVTKRICWADLVDEDDEEPTSLPESSITNNDLPKNINNDPPKNITSPVISAISTTDSINGMLFKYKRCPLIDTINGCPHQNENNAFCPITEGIHPTRICENGINCKYVISDYYGNVRKINCTFLHPEVKIVHQQVCTFNEQKRCNFNDTCCHNIHIPHHISNYKRNIFKKLLQN